MSAPLERQAGRLLASARPRLTWQRMLAVGLGAMVGANARYLITYWSVQRWGWAFPYGTMFINVLGSFLIGAILGRFTLSEEARLFLVTGILGGFTTYSSFSFECRQLWMDGQLGYFAAYLGGTLVLGLVAVFAGGAWGSWLAR